MRNFIGNIATGMGVALVAGLLAIALPAQALAAPATAPSPRAEAPAISGAEIRSDEVVQRPDPSIVEAAQPVDMDIVACASVPPMPRQANAEPKPGAGRVGNAGARVAK